MEESGHGLIWGIITGICLQELRKIIKALNQDG
jgi:hypothetical protein